MTGPEHYQEAQRHAAKAAEWMTNVNYEQRAVAAAQLATAHATLAQVAAMTDFRDSSQSIQNIIDWEKATR